MILQIFISLIVLQEIYRFLLYNLKLSKFKKHLPNQNYNQFVERIYLDSLKLKSNENEDLGLYYDDISYDYFEINTTHNASIFKKSFFQKSPYLYDFEQSEIKNNDLILDCGCGSGSFSIYIAQKNPTIQIHSISNSKKCIEITNQKIKKHNLQDRIFTHLLDFDQINSIFKENQFDKIFFLESHGYSKDRNNLFQNCNKLLNKNGLLYIRTPVLYDRKNEENIHYSKVTNYWRYNFSTTNNICIDLEKNNFTNIKTMEVSPILLFASYDPFIILKIFLFMHHNSNVFENTDKFITHLMLIYKGIMFAVIKSYKKK